MKMIKEKVLPKSKLSQLCEKCKCGIFVTINEHRDYYKTVEETLFELGGMECPPEIEEDVRTEMVRKDTIVNVQFYPDTPIGSYDIYHWDLETALDIALEILNKN